MNQKTPLKSLLFALLMSPALLLAEETSSRYVEQALVHTITPDEKKHDLPIIMIPGLNLSSYIYLATPDGRDGWAQQFAAAGYEVHVINDPKFDFSHGFSVPGFKDVPEEGAPPANPNASQGWDQDIWPRWGFGKSEGNPYTDTRFPTDDFDAFEANYPYLSSASSSYSQAIAALLEDVGPAILMPHSAGCPQAVSAATAKPNLVAGFVVIEPTSPPKESHFPTFAGMSMLGVYGDYIESRRQTGRKEAVELAAELFDANGGKGEVISLPEDYGINGNTHLMMQDKNSAFVGELIIDWIAENIDGTTGSGPGGGGMTGGGKGKGGSKGGKGGKGGRAGMTGVLTQLDADQNGALDFDEFRKSPRYSQFDRTDARDAFDKMDTNENGFISTEELQAGVSARGGKGGGKGRKGGASN